MRHNDSHSRHWWLAMGLAGMSTVALGAFASHGLRGTLSADMLRVFETGIRYQMWHVLAAVAVLAWRSVQPLRGQMLTLGLWAAGILMFSGSLYALATTARTQLGIITPLGGLLLIAGWLSLAVTGWRQRGSEEKDNNKL